MFQFEELGVWRKAVAFADCVYAATRSFPDEERSGLTRQMRRAAVSISSNIAAGSGKSSDKDFAHFVETAQGSLMEVLSQVEVARLESFLPADARDDLYRRAEELARMLSGLRVSLLRDDVTSISWLLTRDSRLSHA